MNLEDSLRKIAQTMQMVDRHPGRFQEEQYYKLVVTHYENLKQQQANVEQPLPESALISFVEKQLAELMRMGRAHKLLSKIEHIQTPDSAKN